MNPLFLQQAKQVWPGLNAQEIALVLWVLTKYPLEDPEDSLRALKNAYERSGGDLLHALNQADEERTKNLTGGRGS